MSDDAPGKPPEKGAPMWVVTFGDLMSLLLCFFVLLLSFSEMDKAKYKELCGSLSEAFGVQRQEKYFDRPKGQNVVAKDFDQDIATRPQDKETGLKRKLITVEDIKSQEDDPSVQPSEKDRGEEEEKETGKDKNKGKNVHVVYVEKDAVEEAERNASREYAKYILEKEIEARHKGEKDKIEIDVGKGQMIIRLMGESTFDSGKTAIRRKVLPLLEKIASSILTSSDDIVIAGHTDNVPIRGGRYKNNLELSIARAYTVADFFIKKKGIDPKRIATMGYGEFQPVATNKTARGREKNRRVEIIFTEFHVPGKIQTASRE